MADEEIYDEAAAGGEEYDDAAMGEEYAEEGGDAEAGGTLEELEAMKRKLKEMEEEAARLKAMQGAGGEPSSTAAGAAGAAASASVSEAEKEEADGRSVYIGNVDYAATPEELQQHFQSCGTVNRVTILTDRTGNPKGYAYLEFLEVDAVANALLLDNSELRGRQIKVMPKRTNVPGLKARGRGRGRGGGWYGPPPYAGRGGYGYGPPPFRGGGRGGYGYAPRGRGRGRFFSPY